MQCVQQAAGCKQHVSKLYTRAHSVFRQKIAKFQEGMPAQRIVLPILPTNYWSPGVQIQTNKHKTKSVNSLFHDSIQQSAGPEDPVAHSTQHELDPRVAFALAQPNLVKI